MVEKSATDVLAQRRDVQEYGFIHSKGRRAFFSANPGFFYSFLAEQGKTPDTPGQINTKIERALENGETRHFLVVVDGTLSFLRTYQEHLSSDVDFIVYSGSQRSLDFMGVEILDEDWSEGDPPLPALTDLLLNR